MSKVLVQFDGSNFYNKVKSLSKNIHLTNYHYKALADFLTNKKNTDKDILRFK